MGSSGGGGGGGSSDWPAYMKTIHSRWLDHEGQDWIKYSITQLMSAAQDASPYANYQAIAPSTYFGVPSVSVFSLVDTYRDINVSALWVQTQNELMNSTIVLNAVKTHADFLRDEMEENVLPQFKTGMRNINAVMSSAFVVGDGLIRSTVIKSISRYASEVQLKVTDIAQRVFEIKLNWYKDCIIQATEVSRISLAAQLDAAKYNSETMAKDKLWNLRTYEYGVQVMAAISGGTANNSPSESSAVSNALGGAMSGAAVGAQVGAQMGSSGGAYGAAIGAVAGLAMSFAR